MWTEQKDVIKFANDFLEEVSIDGIQSFAKDLKIVIPKEIISSSITFQTKIDRIERSKSGILENYDMFNSTLKVYGSRCLQYCFILRQISGEIKLSKNIFNELDITIKDNKVLTSDLLRILKPLKNNYRMACELKEKAEKINTYLEMVDKIPPIKYYSGVYNSSRKPREEAINMSEKQMANRQKLREKLMEQAKKKYEQKKDL